MSDISDHFDDHLGALADLLAAEGLDMPAAQGIPRRDPAEPTPMSFSQELLWMLDRSTPGLTAYNLPVSRRLRGSLDVVALRKALTDLVSRHEVLRTRFVEDAGTPRQVIDAPREVDITIVETSGASIDERESDAKRIVRERARSTFDLAVEHLFRVTLVRIAPDDHILVLETHHIVMDGWSLGVVFRELAALYAAARRGERAVLDVPAIQYGDYAAWQREHLSGARLDSLLQFWRGQLGDATEPLELPTDKRRSPTLGFAGARETLSLSADDTAAIKQYGQANGVTLYMMLLAAYGTVLHRYSGKTNVLIGSGSAGRTLPETEGLVGYVNNTVVQRADFSGDPTFGELVMRVRQSALDAYDHQDVPLEKLVLELRKGDAQRGEAPLFDVVLTMQDVLSSGLALDDVTVEPFGADLGATKFDITLLVSERKDRINLTSQYRSELFTPATMQRFLTHVNEVLRAGVAAPATRISALSLLSRGEHAQLSEWNDTAANEGEQRTIAELFEASAQRVPNRAAVVAPGATANTVTLTYAELDARANQLAHYLLTIGAGARTPVGMLVENSANALVAMLGILKSGAAYVPLSPDAPLARLEQQMTEADAAVLVTVSALAGNVPPRVRAVVLDRDSDLAAIQQSPQSAPVVERRADDLAYVLFTSGSTGTPKGVAVSNANAVHYARAVSRVFGGVAQHTAGDAFSSLDGWQFGLASTLAADLGNTSLLLSLFAGGTLHVLGKQLTTEPERFAAYVQANPLDLLKITPGHLMAMIGDRRGSEMASVMPRVWTVVGGEPLRIDVAHTLLSAARGRLLNHYGPTETTVGVCTFEVTAASLSRAEQSGAQTIPIGKPLANTRAYVVDDRGNEQPIGIPGELWIGGAGVAQGYIGRSELTAERFVSHAGERVYRTGDRVRRLESGDIEHLGRNDDQVKIRGFRVELGDVASALRAHAGVEDAIALLDTPEGGDARLVAYVVPKKSGYAVSHADRPTPERLAEWSATLLPEYMVPSVIMMIDELPRTANGKVNVRALPAPGAAQVAEPSIVEPRTETERALVGIWKDVLKHERVGVTDSFLTLGGHSLLAIRVLGRISKQFGVRLALRTLFETPTIEALAELVDLELKLAALAQMSDEDAARMLAGEPDTGATT